LYSERPAENRILSPNSVAEGLLEAAMLGFLEEVLISGQYRFG
jgi:hypothetical protein